jgi:hypothetical protein
MLNYGFGNCIISIEGDENIYSVVPYYKGIELEKNTGYLRDGYIYIYRGDISKQKKFKNGIFTDKKGKVYFSMDPDEKEKFAFDNIKDDSIQSIIKQAEQVDPNLKRKIMKQITQSSDIYLPELDVNDDCFKHLVKLMLHEKRIDLKQYKHLFSKAHFLTNLKASLEQKSSADGKRGSLTTSNLFKWLSVLGMDIEITCKDSEESEDPCGKIFKYSSKEGFNTEWNDDYEHDDNDNNDEGEDDE